MTKTLTVTWHENAIKRALESVSAIVRGEKVDADSVWRVGDGVLSWMDLACLVDLGRHAVEHECPDSPAAAGSQPSTAGVPAVAFKDHPLVCAVAQALAGRVWAEPLPELSVGQWIEVVDVIAECVRRHDARGGSA